MREVLKNDFDLIVVGGGPSGATAAFNAGGRGLRVLLLDKSDFPRDKPCGGGISYRVLTRFSEIADHIRRSIPIHYVHKVLMDSPSGERVLVTSEEPFYLMVRRIEFDAALVDLARETGVQVVRGRVTGVKVREDSVEVHCVDGRTFGGQLVIGADGVNSVVATEVGLHNGWPTRSLAIDTMEETELSELNVPDMDTMYVAYGYKKYLGYGYVFPKTTHVDLGIGFFLSYYQEQLNEHLYEYHRRMVEDLDAQGFVRGRSVRKNFKAFRIPLGGPLSPSYAERSIVCGDAGGFVNGFTAEGIYYAMVSGHHAGQAAAQALESGDLTAKNLARYEERWRHEIGGELRHSMMIQRRLFADPGLIDSLIRAAARDPKLRRVFAGVAVGKESLRERWFEIVLRLVAAALRGRIKLRYVIGGLRRLRPRWVKEERTMSLATKGP